MDKTSEMIEVLEGFLIKKVNSLNVKQTSPAEISALAELVSAVSMLPRTLEARN